MFLRITIVGSLREWQACRMPFAVALPEANVPIRCRCPVDETPTYTARTTPQSEEAASPLRIPCPVLQVIAS
jgi:hypothetical protein